MNLCVVWNSADKKENIPLGIDVCSKTKSFQVIPPFQTDWVIVQKEISVRADRHFSLFIGHVQKGHNLSNKISLEGKIKQNKHRNVEMQTGGEKRRD